MQRYAISERSLGPALVKHVEGEWIRFADVASLAAELAEARALVEKRERQIEKLESLCHVYSRTLLFAPTGVRRWEIYDDEGNSWLKADTFVGLLAAIAAIAAIDEACE